MRYPSKTFLSWAQASRLIAICIAAWLALPAPAAAIKIEKIVSPGGITAWLVQEHTVPVISVNFIFRGGASLDPAGKEGLAEMVSSLLDEGAGKLNSQAFQSRLEDIAASLRFSAGRDSFRGRLRTLSANRNDAFHLLRLALSQPRFDADPVARIRAQTIAGLKRSAERPRTIAGRLWYKTVFGSHPYSRPVDGTPESVKAIVIDDLKNFAKIRFGRDKLLIGVVGDITPDELALRLDEMFGALPPKSAGSSVEEAMPEGTGRTIVVQRKIPQSVVVFGQEGVKRDDPDYYTASVMVRILGGGGLTSRLNYEVREKRGLAYAVYSYLNPLEHAGLIMGSVATANERVGKSLGIIRSEWKRMAESGVTEEELATAKTYINGSFPLRLDSSRRIARLLVGIQFSRLGIDYMDRRAKLIDAVTMDDIKRVAKRLLRESALTVVVVGQPEGVTATP